MFYLSIISHFDLVELIQCVREATLLPIKVAWLDKESSDHNPAILRVLVEQLEYG